MTKLDAELMFECLIYLNIYYYPVFSVCEAIMSVLKWQSRVDTPNIAEDAGVIFAVLFAEIGKILLYEKYKDVKRDLITAVAVSLTCLTICGSLYTFFFQTFVVRLEYILCAMMIMLAVTEVIFGILQILPCCKKVQYY